MGDFLSLSTTMQQSQHQTAAAAFIAGWITLPLLLQQCGTEPPSCTFTVLDYDGPFWVVFRAVLGFGVTEVLQVSSRLENYL